MVFGPKYFRDADIMRAKQEKAAQKKAEGEAAGATGGK